MELTGENVIKYVHYGINGRKRNKIVLYGINRRKRNKIRALWNQREKT